MGIIILFVGQPVFYPMKPHSGSIETIGTIQTIQTVDFNPLAAWKRSSQMLRRGHGWSSRSPAKSRRGPGWTPLASPRKRHERVGEPSPSPSPRFEMKCGERSPSPSPMACPWPVRKSGSRLSAMTRRSFASSIFKIVTETRETRLNSFIPLFFQDPQSHASRYQSFLTTPGRDSLRSSATSRCHSVYDDESSCCSRKSSLMPIEMEIRPSLCDEKILRQDCFMMLWEDFAPIVAGLKRRKGVRVPKPNPEKLLLERLQMLQEWKEQGRVAQEDVAIALQSILKTYTYQKKIGPEFGAFLS